MINDSLFAASLRWSRFDFALLAATGRHCFACRCLLRFASLRSLYVINIREEVGYRNPIADERACTIPIRLSTSSGSGMSWGRTVVNLSKVIPDDSSSSINRVAILGNTMFCMKVWTKRPAPKVWTDDARSITLRIRAAVSSPNE